MLENNKKKSLVLPSVVLMGLSCVSAQAATLMFEDIRFAQNGTVVGGTTSSFTFNSVTLGPVATAVYTVTSDFDGDGVTESFDFDLMVTSGTGTNIGTNGGGFVGVGSPRIGLNESLEYALTPSSSSVALSGGGTGLITFDGFTGGSFANSNFVVPGTSFDANGQTFTTSGDFVVPTANTLDIEVTGLGSAAEVFTNGVAFDITVDVVPEPSSAALLGLGAFAFMTRRRR